MTGILGATVGSFFSSSSIPANGLQLYLDASNPASYGGSGNTWFDLSGNGRHFTWNTPSFNSSGIKYFNTQSRLATGPASNSFNVTNTSGYTIFITLFQNSLIESGAFNWHSSSNPGVNSRGIFAHMTWSDASIYWDQGGCCDPGQRTNVALPSPSGTWHVIALRNNYAATNRTIWRDNSILTTNTSAISNINLSSTGANIGGSSTEYGQSSSTWNARIGQFAMYNRALSDSEMTQVYQTFRTKVGI
jgi:hypothetical protein